MSPNKSTSDQNEQDSFTSALSFEGTSDLDNPLETSAACRQPFIIASDENEEELTCP